MQKVDAELYKQTCANYEKALDKARAEIAAKAKLIDQLTSVMVNPPLQLKAGLVHSVPAEHAPTQTIVTHRSPLVDWAYTTCLIAITIGILVSLCLR